MVCELRENEWAEFLEQTHALKTTFQVRKAVLVDRYLYFAPPITFPLRFFSRTQSQLMKNNLETLHAKRGLQKAIMAATDQLSAPRMLCSKFYCRVTAPAAAENHARGKRLQIFFIRLNLAPTQHPEIAFNRLSCDCHADIE